MAVGAGPVIDRAFAKGRFRRGHLPVSTGMNATILILFIVDNSIARNKSLI